MRERISNLTPPKTSMIILSIETSCDETAVSLVSANGDFPHATYTLLGNALFSQIDIHREYGGVFPMVAKREHARTLVPMLEKALREAKLLVNEAHAIGDETLGTIKNILARESDLETALIPFLSSHTRPQIDLISVTHGPGLEPALWVGVNFARALAASWEIPVVSANHMEGHILSSVFDGTKIADITFPALALLISGGHTELVLIENWGVYTTIGETRDDAVGEAFDKSARMLGLPYPGGPEISRCAAHAREIHTPPFVHLPRPMLNSGDFDFSFSGLKTAVRYAVQNVELTENIRSSVAREFEDAVTEVLLHKTLAAVDAHGIHTVIIGGGVSANTHIRNSFSNHFREHYPEVSLYLPDPKLSTDNAIMIALTGHAHAHDASTPNDASTIRAIGNLHLT